MKNFWQHDFVNSFATLPLELVYPFNDPNDMISVFNELISNHINEHAPLKTIRVTRPAAPWMKDRDCRPATKVSPTEDSMSQNKQRN